MKKMTINIYETMKSCLMNYRYSNDQRPLRPLTVPSLGKYFQMALELQLIFKEMKVCV